MNLKFVRVLRLPVTLTRRLVFRSVITVPVTGLQQTASKFTKLHLQCSHSRAHSHVLPVPSTFTLYELAGMNRYERLPVDTPRDLENGQPDTNKPRTDFVFDVEDEAFRLPTRPGSAFFHRLQHVSDSTLSFLNVNAGLLLVAASQAFFASMNTAVKKLNNLDPPVSALEVSFQKL